MSLPAEEWFPYNFGKRGESIIVIFNDWDCKYPFFAEYQGVDYDHENCGFFIGKKMVEIWKHL